MTTLDERLKENKKRILSCDGGGIRGLMTVEILSKLESDLRAQLKKPDLVLADYFHFACGTSTGAIIAACISCGMSTGEIRDFYVNSGKEMFAPAALIDRLRYQYDSAPLARMLQEVLQKRLGDDVTLGSAQLRTLLMMVMRNVTTDSPWPVWNNKAAKYNDRSRIDCNLNLPLWQLVRASTAAPVYFPPEVVTFAKGTPREYTFIFVDGGVTSYNNPAFLAFEMATASPYKLNWAATEDQMLILSVSTGGARMERIGLEAGQLSLLDNAKNIPSALMNAASAGWDMACRVVGNCRFGDSINREFGDMLPDAAASAQPNWTGTKAFTYIRYAPDLSASGLKTLGLSDVDPSHVQKMDSVDYISDIQRVGQAYAKLHVQLDHFKGFF